MNLVALSRALRFACVPTLSLLALLFFAFFSVTRTITFISSDDGAAVALRIVAFLAEVILVSCLYSKYRKEEVLKGNTGLKNKRERNSNYEIHDLKESGWYKRDTYYVQDTDDDNIVYVQRVPYNN
jgi:hypothetical protein